MTEAPNAADGAACGRPLLSRLEQGILWVCGVLTLMEVLLFTPSFGGWSQVFTEQDGQFSWGVGWEESDEPITSTVPTDCVPHTVQIDDAGNAANVYIRYYAGNGMIYGVNGDARVARTDGRVLWASDFRAVTEDLGPAVFAAVFTDVNGDGRREILYGCGEHGEVYCENDLDGLRVVPGPVLIQSLDGRGTPVIPCGWLGRWRAGLLSAWLQHEMQGFGMQVLDMVALAMPVMVGLIVIVNATHRRKSKGENSNSERKPTPGRDAEGDQVAES